MKIRCIHFDMKSMIPKVDFFLGMLDNLAEMGYTHVLMEFEDKFPFESYPDAVRNTAYTQDDFRRVAEKCRQLGMGVIPLLQSIGHLHYFLKEPAYRKWSENGNIYQWCLSQRETYDIWTAMTDEILDIFPDCVYFHIGADEMSFKSPCPLCAGKDQFQLFVARVNECADYIIAKGKQPLVWDDVFRKHEFSESGDLLSKVIPCVWQYREINKDIIKRYAEAGIRYWGTSAIQSNAYFYAGMGKQRPHLQNVDDWADVQAEFPAEGHIGTLWGRIQSLDPINTTLPQGMYVAAYLAETLLHGKIQDRHVFNRKFAERFFGLPELNMDIISYGFGNEPAIVKKELEKYLGNAPRNGEYLEIWHAFNEIDVLFGYVQMCFSSNQALLSSYRKGLVTDGIINNWSDGVRITRERTEALTQMLEATLGKVYPMPELREFIEERFMSMLEINEKWGEILRETASKPHL